MTSLIMRFSVSRIIQFYFFFEMRAVIIFCFVLSLGYQPERMVARMFLLLFTVGSSLPFLLLLIMFNNFIHVETFQVFIGEIQSTGQNQTKNFFTVMLTLGFLVKFPIYFFHVWLPKAHVEASARGSMVLAGILLKLGRYGLFRVRSYLRGGLEICIRVFALLGARVVRIVCCRIADLKIVIAYSSVAHIRFLVGRIIIRGGVGRQGSLAMRVRHGVVSSAMFFCVGLLYQLRGSRLSYFNRGGLAWIPWFSFFWCGFCLLNIGTPPRLNFWREIILVFRVVGVRGKTLLLFIFPLFRCVVYSLLLYVSTQPQKFNLGALSPIVGEKKDMLIINFHLCWLWAHRLIFFLFK